jgi:2-succinyl-6-hydroxy-2,4-cyclohexadiene-1-carboxylate synthase
MMTMHLVTVTREDGTPLRYAVRAAGHGAPVMLLHGFTGSGDVWADVSARLEASYTVIRPDGLGHGETDAPEDPSLYDIERCSDDLVQIASALGYTRFGLHGYSMGGRLALGCAIRYPHRVSALSLESASPGLMGEEERAARRASDEALATRILRDGVAPFIETWERLALFDGLRRLPDKGQARLRAIRLAQRAQGLAGSLVGMGTGAQPSYWEALEGLPMPVLVMTGAQDEKFEAIGKRMATLIPRASHVSVGGAGHTVHLEQPAAWLAALGEFWAATLRG